MIPFKVKGFIQDVKVLQSDSALIKQEPAVSFKIRSTEVPNCRNLLSCRAFGDIARIVADISAAEVILVGQIGIFIYEKSHDDYDWDTVLTVNSISVEKKKGN